MNIIHQCVNSTNFEKIVFMLKGGMLMNVTEVWTIKEGQTANH